MKLTIAHLFPELLNLYGDGGNVIALERRCSWRGIDVEVVPVRYGEVPAFDRFDLAFIGGGSDRDQRIVCDQLHKVAAELGAFVEDNGVLLAVCGGYQLLGHSYLMGDEEVEGLHLVDIRTDRGTPRLIGNVLIESEACPVPIVGYENHGGRTYLGEGVKPLGRVIKGFGNDGASGYEGVWYRNVIGTYIHGPLLPKNPGLADFLIRRALERREGGPVELAPLDDAVELTANEVMRRRIMNGEVQAG